MDLKKRSRHMMCRKYIILKKNDEINIFDVELPMASFYGYVFVANGFVDCISSM